MSNRIDPKKDEKIETNGGQNNIIDSIIFQKFSMNDYSSFCQKKKQVSQQTS